MRLLRLLLLAQVFSRLLEIVIRVGELPGAHTLLHAQVVEIAILRQTRVGTPLDLGPARTRFVGSHVVHDHHRVFSVLVLPVIVDALVLHEPAHEIERGLIVLHAKDALLIAAAELELEVLEPVVAKRLFYYFLDRPLLENAAVARPRQEPEPRHDLRMIGAHAALIAEEHHRAHIAVKVARAPVLHLEAHGNIRPHQLIPVHIARRLQEHGVIFKEPAQLLAAAHGFEQQLVFAELRFDRGVTLVLGGGGHRE